MNFRPKEVHDYTGSQVNLVSGFCPMWVEDTWVAEVSHRELYDCQEQEAWTFLAPLKNDNSIELVIYKHTKTKGLYKQGILMSENLLDQVTLIAGFSLQQ